MTQDQFGGAPADVHHQPALGGLGQQVRHPLVDQARFFASRNHVDRESQNLVGPRQEFITVARLAQRLRGDGPNLTPLQPRQAFAKARQTVPATLHRLGGEVAIFVQAVALADGFLEVLGALNLAMLKASDFQTETVGAEIDGGEEGTVLHG